jgi:hypothetical protein
MRNMSKNIAQLLGIANIMRANETAKTMNVTQKTKDRKTLMVSQ